MRFDCRSLLAIARGLLIPLALVGLRADAAGVPPGALQGLSPDAPHAASADAVSVPSIAALLQVGDVVFIRVGALPFREVAATTDSWTNHVGVVVDASGAEPVIAESTFPVSRRSTLSRFVARSERGQVSVRRLAVPLTEEQARRVADAAQRRLGIFYDTGFNLRSPRQFCSRFVREVIEEATGQSLGEVETFAQLLSRHPGAGLGFWKLWYFGRIPWTRETVTPASVLRSAALRPVFEGSVRASGAKGNDGA